MADIPAWATSALVKQINGVLTTNTPGE